MVINWKLSKRESSDVERMTYVKKRARLPFCFTGFGRLQLLTVRTLLVFSSLRIAIRTMGFRELHFLNYKQGKLVVVVAFFFFFFCVQQVFFFYFLVLFAPCLSEFFFFFPVSLFTLLRFTSLEQEQQYQERSHKHDCSSPFFFFFF